MSVYNIKVAMDIFFIRVYDVVEINNQSVL